MKTKIISRNLSDKSTVHNLRITDDEGHWIEIPAISFPDARYLEIGIKTLSEKHSSVEVESTF